MIVQEPETYQRGFKARDCCTPNKSTVPTHILGTKKCQYKGAVGIGLGEHPMDVSMVGDGRGIHVFGYNWLAIKSID